MVYNYFADNFGHAEKIPDEALVNKYRDQTVKELKKSLKKLKLSNAEPHEMKYVSRTLREKLRINVKTISMTRQLKTTMKYLITTISLAETFGATLKTS